MSLQNLDQTIPCSECQTGQMRRRYVTYFTWLGDELITVPDFPAFVCDVCKRREYDYRALNRLSLLLNPGAGRPFHRQAISPAKVSGKIQSSPLD